MHSRFHDYHARQGTAALFGATFCVREIGRHNVQAIEKNLALQSVVESKVSCTCIYYRQRYNTAEPLSHALGYRETETARDKEKAGTNRADRQYRRQ